ncbi:MAG: AAA family ATPase, partial [Rickettsiales bacterium]
MENSIVYIDFNDAPEQDGVTITKEISINEINSAIERQIKNYVLYLFPSAQINRGKARIGSVVGEPGASLVINLDGADTGLWFDHNTGEKGNAIQLWQETNRLSFSDALQEIKQWLGYDDKPLKKSLTQQARDAQPKPALVQLGAPDNQYQYLDRDGNIIATVRRYNTENGKTFRVWDAVAGKAQQPTPKPLYNIPGILDADEIVFVEGEKAADAVIAAGFVATSLMSGGNSRLDKTDFSPIAGKNVLLWPDNDDVGGVWLKGLLDHLPTLGCSVRALKPPPWLPQKGDAADCTSQEIRHLVLHAGDKPKTVIDWIPADQMEYVIAGNWTVKKWIPGSGLGCLYGDPGSGKTFSAADLALHIATGMDWQGERTSQAKVAYLAMESGRRFQNRVKAWCDHYNADPQDNFVYTPISVDLRKNAEGADAII